MAWIGLRTRDSGTFAPSGLGRPAPAQGIQDALIPVGSLLIEVTISPVQTPQNLLRFSVMDPWPARLSVVQEPDGTFRLLLRQGSRTTSVGVKTTLGDTAETLRIIYTWNAPARRGALSVYSPERDLIWLTELPDPFPMPSEIAKRLMADMGAGTMSPALEFAAIASHLMPVGPVPGIDPAAEVETATGPRKISTLVPGDLVRAPDGGLVQVRWAGCEVLPAAGLFAPLTLRAPYHGARHDLVLSQEQRLALWGPEVEYLFGHEQVAAAAHQLSTRSSFDAGGSKPVLQPYWQVLLDSPVAICVNGAWLETLDVAAIRAVPGAYAFSVLRDLPKELLPAPAPRESLVLRRFEALSLSGVSYG